MFSLFVKILTQGIILVIPFRPPIYSVSLWDDLMPILSEILGQVSWSFGIVSDEFFYHKSGSIYYCDDFILTRKNFELTHIICADFAKRSVDVAQGRKYWELSNDLTHVSVVINLASQAC